MRDSECPHPFVDSMSPNVRVSSWAIRLAVCNIGWTAHPTYRSGEGSFALLADTYTGVISVYSSKQCVRLSASWLTR